MTEKLLNLMKTTNPQIQEVQCIPSTKKTLWDSKGIIIKLINIHEKSLRSRKKSGKSCMCRRAKIRRNHTSGHDGVHTFYPITLYLLDLQSIEKIFEIN